MPYRKLEFCKEKDNYVIKEHNSSNFSIKIIDQKISLVDIFHNIFESVIANKEPIKLTFVNNTDDSDENVALFNKIKNLLNSISFEINNYIKTLY